MLSKRSNITIIGAGKIAYSIISALQSSKYRVAAVISRKLESASKLSKKFSNSFCSDQLSAIPKSTRIFFLTVPDNEIEHTARKLSSLSLSFSNSLFVHFSGAEDSSLLKPLKNKNAFTASFHIMQTFPSKKVFSIKGSFACIETDDKPAEKFLYSLAEQLELHPFSLDAAGKKYYHASGVFASNFLIGNLFRSISLLNLLGIEEREALQLLKPIVISSVKNVLGLGIEKALSGPVERGDITTIKKQVNALKKLSSKSEVNFSLLSYVIQSLQLVEFVESKKDGQPLNLSEVKQYLLRIILEKLSRKN